MPAPTPGKEFLQNTRSTNKFGVSPPSNAPIKGVSKDPNS
jgi:hypothetical protein